MNLYAYVGNDPVNNTDPLGLASTDFSIFGTYYFGGKPFTPVALPTLPSTIPSPGDMISDPNGNVWGDSRRQDGVCSLPGPLGPLADSCVLDRCQKHDECYEEEKCNASSWVSSALGGTKSCNQCNGGFFD